MSTHGPLPRPAASAMGPGPGRRRFLAASGATAIGAALGSLGPWLRSAAAQALSDGSFAAFAESVELAMVQAYGPVVDLSSEGLRPLVETHRRHHADHAETCAGLAGREAKGRANATLDEVLGASVAELSGQGEALAFARALEDQMAATYAYATTLLADAEAAGVVASILAVEASHATTLRTVLDEPVGASFPDGAFDTADIARGFAPEAFPLR